MDVAYDHITEENLSPGEKLVKEQGNNQAGSLNAELQEAYKSITTSPWGARLGGFLGTVRKQGESYYQGAKKEAAEIGDEAMKMGDEALKGFTDLKSTLVSRTRSLSLDEQEAGTPVKQGHESTSSESILDAAAQARSTPAARSDSDAHGDSEGLIARFRSEAARRLKDIEKAEDAADEALLKFGTNIRNFLRDAVSVTAPSSSSATSARSDSVLFESKDADGKRVFHSTRFDAQLHAIHSSPDSLAHDPASAEFLTWAAGFDAASKTMEIAADLEKYEELRRVMERLVPEMVDYETFWKRYYFLRMVIESEEARRKEMLSRAALSPVEEIGWDEDSDSDSDSDSNPDSSPGTPQPRNSTSTLHAPTPRAKTSTSTPTSTTTTTTTTTTNSKSVSTPSSTTTTTTNNHHHHNNNTTTTTDLSATPTSSRPTTSAAAIAPQPPAASSTTTTTAAEPRKSQDQNSQADSDASYDLVSGVPSAAPGSPVEEKEKEKEKEKAARFKTGVGKVGVAGVHAADEEEEEEEDWE